MSFRQSGAEHPSRELLLAWLDGEVGRWRRRMIARHLDRCWQCRTAAAETEATIRAVQEKERTFSTIDRASLAKAKWRFRESASGLQTGNSNDAKRWRLNPVAAAAVVLLVVLGGWLSTNRSQPKATVPDQEALLHKVEGAEIGSFNTSVRQDRFIVEIGSGGASAGVSRDWRVWTAPAERLYASRWSKPSGQLQHAQYASGDAMASVYSNDSGLMEVKLPAARPHVPLFRAVAASGGDAAALERDFIRWLDRQTWKPVSLAREMAEFASLDGAVLRIARAGGVIRWVAEASIEGRRLRMTMESESESRPPRLVELAWLAGEEGRVLRIRRVERLEYANAKVAAAFFRPDRGLAVRRAPTVPSVEAEPLAIFPETKLLEAEVEVLSAIHRARLCLGDDLHVDRIGRIIQVTGHSASEERRGELLALFGGIAGREFVRIDLKIAPVLPASTAQSPAAALDENQAQILPAAAEGWLRQHLRVGKVATEREMFDRMNGLVRGADEVAAESWALRRLAERFPSEREAKLTESVRAQVREMAEEHALAMWNQLRLLEPMLPAPAGERRRTEDFDPERGWQQRAVLLQKRAAATSAMILQLFSSSGAPQLTDGTAAQRVLDQIAELPALIDSLRRASLAMCVEFAEDGSAARNQ
jgi:hypothetical protein